MKNNIIFMVFPPHSSHLTQPLDIGVFSPLKTLMASAIEPLVSTKLHHILKAEWLAAYVKAHDGAFSIQNILLPFDPSKVLNCIKPVTPIIQDSITARDSRDSTPLDLTTPFKDSVLTSSPLYTDETRSANAALLSEIITNGILSTPTRNYAQCVIRRSERVHVRNIIIKEEHAKLKAAVTRRKAILTGKRKVVDGKHILTTLEVHSGLVNDEKKVKKRKTIGTKKG